MHPAQSAILLGAVLVLHVVHAPFTKVEESFSLQAVHDILTYGIAPESIAAYDHIAFPGAVPRSFLGPLLLAGLTAPLLGASKALGIVLDASQVQLAVRIVLALATWAALIFFCTCVFPRHALAQRYFYLLCAAQFHLTFWTGRTTPNGIAFPLAVAALGAIVGHRGTYAGLVLLVVTASTLRFEIFGLCIPAYLWVWRSGKRFAVVFWTGLFSIGLGALLSLGVDSYFWRHVDKIRVPHLGAWVWPEISAMQFNVVDGHASNWGTMPWHTYLVHDIPRMLTGTLPLFLVGLIYPVRAFPRAAILCMALFPVGLLSILSHKEWRFILYSVPLLNCVSAVGAVGCHASMHRIVPLACIAAAFACSLLFSHVSALNYPGGAALHMLHRAVPEGGVSVHVDTLAAMTGVTRFQSIHMHRPSRSLVPQTEPEWVYDKREDLGYDDDAWREYTHIITEHANCNVTSRALFTPIAEALGTC
ncbi:dolichyl-P-Man:Man7GlcNAc2-PP-dolichol alpha-1,6-mannosyltransferase [Malassezia vespertilionis]|uniref:dolichyl-P-Man:Man7GlcNAc2-PP-dolichol alpha-1,6-mannosyltransferase n=1 Tax=Malassezia vespertilionis TaxID=2020962 RepID=UPI0024B0726B|nr:dolichyl-P-Man:Man7GlcNAc2-PP-dolichol alpha-1,6-mannosyltransferase [Malassezia vespertilionis]WFD06837.1 dolichyl-P-Man:Man7GlcNAc2-PP-dolichol alpha-1,6-mannosyltransferase [Malassezia vespertilionis]